MHSERDNTEIMIRWNSRKLLNSLKNRYQNNLHLVRASKVVFDYAQLLYYKFHKINLNYGGSYIDSTDWIKNKKTTINSINKKDNKCFQCAVTAASNYEEIKKDPKRVTKIKPFINITGKE